MELFLTATEDEANRAELPDKRYELAINQMSITLAASYRRLAATMFAGLSPTYERLIEAMVESVTGLLMISGEAAEGSDPALAAKGRGLPSRPLIKKPIAVVEDFMEVVRNRQDPTGGAMMMPSRVPPRSQFPRPRFGFGEVQGLATCV